MSDFEQFEVEGTFQVMSKLGVCFYSQPKRKLKKCGLHRNFHVQRTNITSSRISGAQKLRNKKQTRFSILSWPNPFRNKRMKQLLLAHIDFHKFQQQWKRLHVIQKCASKAIPQMSCFQAVTTLRRSNKLSNVPLPL